MLKFNEPMSKHCSLRSGGISSEFLKPEDVNELSNFLKTNTKPVLMVGLGSNLLIRDSGFSGVTINTKKSQRPYYFKWINRVRSRDFSSEIIKIFTSKFKIWSRIS